MMNDLIQKFTGQLKVDFKIENFKQPNHPIYQILMAGMGGSGIGSSTVCDIVADDCTAPIVIVNGYKLPHFISKNTLVVLSSYSGNTEETLACMAQAMQTEATIVCVTSGGKMLSTATDHGLPYILLPSGWPSPRACLGFSVNAQITALAHYGLISKSHIEQLRSAAELLIFEQEDIKLKAEKLANILVDRLPILYTTDRAESVVLRWRQQINENSKMLCSHNTIPEMNHNELVGWKFKNEKIAVLFLRYKDDTKQNQLRIEFAKQTINKLVPTVVEIFAKGQTLTEKMFYLIHLGDWVSWYLSKLLNVDASEIQVIDKLKEHLSNQRY